MSEEALGQVLSPLRKSQRTIISLVVQAMATLGQAASIPIAAVVAQRVGSQVDSAIQAVQQPGVHVEVRRKHRNPCLGFGQLYHRGNRRGQYDPDVGI